MKLKQLKQDLKKQANGVWVSFDSIKLKIARHGNPLAQKLTDEHHAQNRALKEENKPEVPFEPFWVDLLSRAILLDWDGVDGEDDKPLTYTSEEGKKVLSDPAFSDLRSFIELQAATRSNFLERGDQAAEKNSQALSSPTSTSAETSAAH
jgi:hypothetical protein